MNWRHHTLPLAGLLTGAALILGAISLTIAILSMVTPLTPDQLKVAQSMGSLHFRNALAIFPALLLAMGLRGLVRISLRQQFGGSAGRISCATVTASTMIVAGVVAGFVVVLSASSIGFAINAIRLSGRPITECDAFAGLSIPIGLIGLMCWNFGHLLFRRWWQDERGVTINA